jgi:hypothetical protein
MLLRTGLNNAKVARAVEGSRATLRLYFRASRSERQVMRDRLDAEQIMVMVEGALKAAQQTQLHKGQRGGGSKVQKAFAARPVLPLRGDFFL